MERARKDHRLFIGTYTDGTASEGMYVLALDGAGRLRVDHAGTYAANPSFLVCAGKRLYVAHELGDRSCLAVYGIASDGALCCLGTCSSRADAGTCFVAVHPGGRCLYGANYQSGSVALCLLAADGSPCGGLPPVRHEGGGPNPARQEGPHVHSACFVPGTSLLAVVDLGCDTVTMYRAEATGALQTPPVETVRVPPGSGPRMLAFHPHLPLAALVEELANDVLLFRFDRAGRHWEQVGRLALPMTAGPAPGLEAAGEPGAIGGPGRPGKPDGRPVLAAHPAFSPDGRRLYASVRGSDRIALFDVDGLGGAGNLSAAVTPRGDFPSGGRGPRHFALSPDGGLMAVANQDSDEVVVFALDPATGTPCEMASAAIPQPSCVAWAG